MSKEFSSLNIGGESFLVKDATARQVIDNLFFNTVADMKNATKLEVGKVVEILGYHSVNDGGGSTYKISSTKGSFSIKLNNGLYANLIDTENELNILKLGAIGDGSSHILSDYFSSLEDAKEVYPCATSLSNEINWCAIQTAINNFSKVIYIPEGVFCINNIITNNKRIHIKGNNKFTTTIKYNVEETTIKSIFLLTDSRNIIENLSIQGPYESNDIADYTNYKLYGINSYQSSYNTFRNIRFFQLLNGISINGSWCINIEDCYIARCNIGINSAGASHVNNIYVKNTQIEYNDIGVFFGEGRNQSLYNCDIENNRTMGLQKTNEGDIQLINCYFEDKVKFLWGSTYISNILLLGCSFFQSPTSVDIAYTPVEFHGWMEHTQVSVINCNFKNLSELTETHTIPAIKQTGNASTVIPTLINNSLTNMAEFDVTTFKGICIRNGKLLDYNSRNYANNFITGSAGGSKDLTLKDIRQARVNLFASGTYNISIPKVELNDRYNKQEFEFIVGGYNSPNNEGVINIIGQEGVSIHGDTTITKNDINKLIKCVYIGEFSNACNWQVIK